MHNLRLVTSFPPPKHLDGYVPMLQKNSGITKKFYGLYDFPLPSPKDYGVLKTRLQLCFDALDTAGIFDINQRPKGILLSITSLCTNLTEAPLYLEAFVEFCRLLRVPLWLLSGPGSDTAGKSVAVEVKHASVLERLQTVEDARIGTVEARIAWWQAFCTTHTQLQDGFILISDRVEDSLLAAEFSYSIGLGVMLGHEAETKAYCALRDFSFVSLLLFGRDIEIKRKVYT